MYIYIYIYIYIQGRQRERERERDFFMARSSNVSSDQLNFRLRVLVPIRLLIGPPEGFLLKPSYP